MLNLDQLPSVLTVEELAQVLRIGRNSAYSLVKSKQIPSIHVGRNIRIPRKSVEAYLNTH